MADVAPAAAVGPAAQAPRGFRYSTLKPVSSEELSVHERLALVGPAAVAARPEGAAGGVVSETTELGAAPWAFLALTRNS